MKSVVRWLICAAFCLSIAGCGEEPQPTTTPDPVGEAPIEEPPAPTAEQVPVPEDFEGEAQSQITQENYRTELDRIEADLGAEAAQ